MKVLHTTFIIHGRRLTDGTVLDEGYWALLAWRVFRRLTFLCGDRSTCTRAETTENHSLD